MLDKDQDRIREQLDNKDIVSCYIEPYSDNLGIDFDNHCYSYRISHRNFQLEYMNSFRHMGPHDHMAYNYKRELNWNLSLTKNIKIIFLS